MIAELIFKTLLQRAAALALLFSSFFVTGSGIATVYSDNGDTFLTPVVIGGAMGLGAAVWIWKLFR